MILDVQKYASLPPNRKGGTVSISIETTLTISSLIFHISKLEGSVSLFTNSNVCYAESAGRTRMKFFSSTVHTNVLCSESPVPALELLRSVSA